MKFFLRRKKKHRLTRIAVKLEKLFQIVWGSKLWVITYSLAIATAYYAGNFGKGYPDDLILDEQLRVLRAQQAYEDSELVISINQSIQDAIQSLQPVLASVVEIKSLFSGIQIVDGKIALTLNKEKSEVSYN